MYGDTTKQFIQFLIDNGPQTAKQLEAHTFFGGVRSRIPKLIEQGRVEKVEVANPLTYAHSRAATIAYKATVNACPEPVQRAGRGKETYAERVRREKKERAVDRAIKLLKQQGYTVVPPISNDDD